MATMSGGNVERMGRLEFASWLILVAMVFDALDGRVARLAGQTSDFGGHLDSLCDVVSFGVAPAALAMSVLSRYYQGWAARLVWVACAVYLVCAVLRLARFNVAGLHSEKAHRFFVGLPSPPAAGMIASFVILHINVLQEYDFPWIGKLVLPVLLLVVGPLMVSKVQYVHLVNELTRGERSFAFLMGLLFVIFLVVILREYIIPVIFTTYLLSGVVGLAVDRVLDRIDLAQNRDSFFR
jgi:CDP-diacylglycerol--serine O-phosphatidyltransferase